MTFRLLLLVIELIFPIYLLFIKAYNSCSAGHCFIMGHKQDNSFTPDLETTCHLLDKLALRQLQLMEDKMRYELKIENSVKNGSYQLAKSRYIMGHTSITSTKLPTEGSPEFSASTICEASEEDGVIQLKAVKAESESTVNPMFWFGVLVPQNMHLAKAIFQNAVNHVVECVNVQLQLVDTFKNIQMLKEYKNMLQSF